MAKLQVSGYLLLTFLVLVHEGQCRKCRGCVTVTLESTGALNRAPVEGASKVRSMKLKHETSEDGRGTCIEGTTYGFLGSEAYVDLGCTGEFEICFVEGRTETITCNSDGSSVTLCQFDDPCSISSVALLETLSSDPCIEGFSFSMSSNGISIMKNCEAKFRVGCRGCAHG